MIARTARSRVFSLGDVGGAVLLKEEVALARVFHALDAGAQLLQSLFKLILHAGDGHDGAVRQPLGAVARQIFAQAQFVFALGVKRGVDDARRVLPQRAPHEEALMIDQRTGQHLNLRHSGAGIPSAVRADALAVPVLKTVHAKIFVCH